MANQITSDVDTEAENREAEADADAIAGIGTDGDAGDDDSRDLSPSSDTDQDADQDQQFPDPDGELTLCPEIFEKLRDAQRRFEKACNQILVMEQQIRDLEARYKRAVRSKKHSFRYNLRLKLSVMTGVKMMYHHYATTKNDEILRIRNLLAQLDFDNVEALL